MLDDRGRHLRIGLGADAVDVEVEAPRLRLVLEVRGRQHAPGRAVRAYEEHVLRRAQRRPEPIEGRAHAARQRLRGPAREVVEEDHDRLDLRHVVVDGDHVDAARAEGREHGRDLRLQHGDIPRHHRVCIASASIPANAAQVLRPMRALMLAP